MAFQGSCHCGAVQFEVDADLPESAFSCNCSHCRRKGFLLAFFPATAFRLITGADALHDYRFNTHRLAHRFCATCGVQAFAEGVSPDGTETRAINLRAIPDVDLDALKVQKIDGAAL
jgi:hypothetical protein